MTTPSNASRTCTKTRLERWIGALFSLLSNRVTNPTGLLTVIHMLKRHFGMSIRNVPEGPARKNSRMCTEESSRIKPQIFLSVRCLPTCCTTVPRDFEACRLFKSFTKSGFFVACSVQWAHLIKKAGGTELKRNTQKGTKPHTNDTNTQPLVDPTFKNSI